MTQVKKVREGHKKGAASPIPLQWRGLHSSVIGPATPKHAVGMKEGGGSGVLCPQGPFTSFHQMAHTWRASQMLLLPTHQLLLRVIKGSVDRCHFCGECWKSQGGGRASFWQRRESQAVQGVPFVSAPIPTLTAFLTSNVGGYEDCSTSSHAVTCRIYSS